MLLVRLHVYRSIKTKRWPFRSWDENFTEILYKKKKKHPYTPKAF